ncbi:Quinolinate phosphoribosyl transferase [Baffinella frigidus]|nr:Quinolinate phosphoribosyl transferase [Cryptophyta sp. CCMP2293]
MRAKGVAIKFFEVEVDTLEQLDALLTLPAGAIDFVLLDNMPPDVLAQAVAKRDASGLPILLEASGGVSLESIGAIAKSGVDRVSVGGLTHQAVSIDIGLDAV